SSTPARRSSPSSWCSSSRRRRTATARRSSSSSTSSSARRRRHATSSPTSRRRARRSSTRFTASSRRSARAAFPAARPPSGPLAALLVETRDELALVLHREEARAARHLRLADLHEALVGLVALVLEQAPPGLDDRAVVLGHLRVVLAHLAGGEDVDQVLDD